MTRENALEAKADEPSAPGLRAVLIALELLVLGVVLGLAWKARTAWPDVPLADQDTWGYLHPALTWLSGLGFEQTDGRDWPYPAMLALFLKMAGSFSGIVMGQKALGLLSGICMAVAWRCWVSMLPFRRWILFLASILGAVPIYVQLVNQQTIFFELSIRPESVLPCFVYAQLACLMGYCKYRWQTPRAKPAVILGAAAILLAYACFLLKPSWYFGAATTSAPVLIGLFGRALSWRIRLAALALGLAAALLLLWLPGRVAVIRDGSAQTLLPDALFCVHAEFILKYFDAKLAGMPDSDPGKAKLQSLVTVLKSELYQAGHGRKVYEKLQFDADYLMHSPQLGEALNVYTDGDRGKFSRFCYASYFRGVWHDPLGYTRKVFSQFTHFLFPEPKTFFVDQFNVTKEYRNSVSVWVTADQAAWRPEVRQMYLRYHEELRSRSRTARSLGKDRRLEMLREKVSSSAFSVEVLFLVALVAALAWAPLHPLRLGGWAAFFLFLAPAGNAFGVCIVHTLDIYRYRVTYGGYLLFALTAMAVFVGIVLAQALAHLVARRHARAVA
ncbi:MAG: hypothetical protein P4L99_14345 [Chthoniobacter sp.]|nr:hypothetical protein [Chthoniobacter sp.]